MSEAVSAVVEAASGSALSEASGPEASRQVARRSQPQGSTTRTGKPAKSATLRVARPAPFAMAIPAIIMSYGEDSGLRSSRGARTSSARRQARSSRPRTGKVGGPKAGTSSRSMRSERRLPSGSCEGPSTISAMAAFVETMVAPKPPIQALTMGSGVDRIRSDTAFGIEQDRSSGSQAGGVLSVARDGASSRRAFQSAMALNSSKARAQSGR